ncbi:hypothetical protein [Kiloniella laminariae]|uniref:hypothetical protein n=1 Tax=Kiloniella laminariae TaxID=454162 RepID=UPI0003786D4A|nr:hypothetical protein [Kiloniella laminariae]
MLKYLLLFLLPLVFMTGLSGSTIERATAHGLHDIDLAITDSTLSKRPAILIAWRNTQKIFEAEVLVRNFGQDEGHGEVKLEIVDELGNVLMSRPESGPGIPVVVPGRDEGGLDGAVVQILGSKAANQLIDRLDRQAVHYSIRATVDTLEGDANDLNNVNSKTYNTETRVFPQSTNFFTYRFGNPGTLPRKIRLELAHNDLPEGWSVVSVPAAGSEIEIPAGGSVQGYATLSAGEAVPDGSFSDITFSAIDLASWTIYDKREWYAVSDNQPPTISEDTVVEVTDGEVYVELVATDEHSGIKEASGVKVEFSVDGGITFSNKVMAYLDGNFVEPTLFQAYLGPFAANTELDIWISASDSAGNVTRKQMQTIIIPPQS